MSDKDGEISRARLSEVKSAVGEEEEKKMQKKSSIFIVQSTYLKLAF